MVIPAVLPASFPQLYSTSIPYSPISFTSLPYSVAPMVADDLEG